MAYRSRQAMKKRLPNATPAPPTTGLSAPRRDSKLPTVRSPGWGRPNPRPRRSRVDDAPPSETQLVKDFYRASGLQEDELAGLPYSLLSAATHGRFRQAGLVRYASASPSVGGVSTAAMHVTLGVTAQTTMYAAIAMRTYLCALARYTAVSETVVLTRLHGSTEEWSAIAQQETEQPKRDAFPDAGRPTL